MAGYLLTSHRLTVGEVLAASRYAVLATGVGVLVGQLSGLVRANAATRRLDEILTVPTPTHGPLHLPPGPGHLELRGVTARHGERTVLDGIDLVIPGGTTLAVVGRSGAGKSLLAAVAGRLTDPDAGEVLLDGVPLHALRHDALRTAIGYAFDRPALLGTTIEDTIAFGLRPPSPPESEKRHAWPTRTPSSAVSRTATPPPSPTRPTPAARPNASAWQGRSPTTPAS